MAETFLSMRNLKFTLHTKVGAFEQTVPGFLGDRDENSLDMVLDAALELGKKELNPIFEEMDKEPPKLENGAVCVHPKVKKILSILGRDGWISAVFPEDWEGEEMPASLLHCINFILGAANYSASVYAGLTIGAARLILNFGDPQLQQIYLPPMLEGKWQGTMALTEPEAGSSLGDLTTRARDLGDGSYAISGEKIFISAGDHDGVENVVHLLLARMEGAPAGSKGISLFVVPKLWPSDQGLEPNHVTVTQIFHKLGYRGAPITGLQFGDTGTCRGILVGEAHRGLSYMFQMMNGARLEVGMGATAIATAAYHASLEYCQSRSQGRRFTDAKTAPQVPIIHHADVKRMLLFQRAVCEGALALILQCGIYEDILAAHPDKTDYHLLLELLTPVAKTYPSEMGILSTSTAIQCFGGYGYCDDFPVEQHFRDMRIHPIHEGTTGIQAMDLLGRKVVMAEGRALLCLKREMEICIEKARQHMGLRRMAGDLIEGMELLESTLGTLGKLAAEQGPEAYLADATPFLEMFGHLVMGWQWLGMAESAVDLLNQGCRKRGTLFYEGKLHTANYYFTYELPKIHSLAKALTKEAKVTLAMPEACFIP
ncbi:MAG: acyl-CoA dehydrogenase [Desulfobacterales bacterium]|nr:acyl-CoA dehydrogenase [Desulfobacterales bacterium]